jgi:hypothetical protein
MNLLFFWLGGLLGAGGLMLLSGAGRPIPRCPFCCKALKLFHHQGKRAWICDECEG